MQRVSDSTGYGAVDDVDYLRAVVDALTGLMDDVGAERGADPIGVLLVARRRRKVALERVTELLAEPVRRLPVVLDPAERSSVTSVQGQPLTPVVTAGVAATAGLSSAQVWMPPGHASHAHVHHHTDVGVVVLHGRAITLWWDEHGHRHELPQTAGQHLHMPFGVVHAAINPFDQPVMAVEWRCNPIFNADNERIEERDAEVRARLPRLRVVA